MRSSRRCAAFTSLYGCGDAAWRSPVWYSCHLLPQVHYVFSRTPCYVPAPDGLFCCRTCLHRWSWKGSGRCGSTGADAPRLIIGRAGVTNMSSVCLCAIQLRWFALYLPLVKPGQPMPCFRKRHVSEEHGTVPGFVIRCVGIHVSWHVHPNGGKPLSKHHPLYIFIPLRPGLCSDYFWVRLVRSKFGLLTRNCAV